MRIVKLSADDISDEVELQEYFDRELPKKNPPGLFRFNNGIKPDGLAKDETVLFSYMGHVRYVVKAASGRLDNTYEPHRNYPYCFVIDMSSVRPVDIEIGLIEKLLRDEAGLQKSLKGQGWTIIPDSEAVARVVESLIADSSSLQAEDAGKDIGAYSPQGGDRRLLIERQIRERRGQASFRDSLRERYGDQCMVTRCMVLAVLEAAHLSPYRGEEDNDPTNGLLLRADIHTLFDLDLLGIEPDKLTVELHPDILKEYAQFAGTRLNCSDNKRPSRTVLQERYGRFRARTRAGQNRK
ncbi:MAG TPA: HNH endonuclease signature motif containing protein [Humisphaera sp.]|nr:HNH endonuclease signature motif containing protein [Humisphaera sp.]